MIFNLKSSEITELDTIFPSHKNFSNECYTKSDFNHIISLAVYLLDQKIFVYKDLKGARKWLLDEKNGFADLEKHDFQLAWGVTKDHLLADLKEIRNAKRILRNIIKRFSNYYFKKYGYYVEYDLLIKIQKEQQ